MLSPATRAAAFLLAELLLRLLRALVSESPNLPAETAASLQGSLEHLVHRLRHLAQTGGVATGQPQAASPSGTETRPIPRARRNPRRIRPAPQRPEPIDAPHPASKRPRRRVALQTPTSNHA